MAKRKLGRGLDALIGRRETVGEADTPAPKTSEPRSKRRPSTETTSGPVQPPPDETPGEALKTLSLNPRDIEVNPDQPRKEFSADELNALKTSVAQEGILQPILVRLVDGRYQLVAGERRLRAAQELSLEKVPALVIEVPDERLLELALIENIHRADLNPVELAEAYQHLIAKNGWTQETLAKKLGVSRPLVANTLRVLELSEPMLNALVRGQITAGHAKVLLSVSDDEERQLLFDRIAEEKLTVRDLEDSRDTETRPPEDRSGARRKPRGSNPKKPYIVSLEEELSAELGSRVRIVERKSGKGSLTVEFYSKDDFERLRKLLIGR